MKKTMKRIASIVLAMAMVFAMAMPAMAEGPITGVDGEYTISVKANKYEDEKHSHEYVAYQIFKGDVAKEDGKKILSTIDWGDGVKNPDGRDAVLSAFSELEDSLRHETFTDIKKLVEFLETHKDDATAARAIAKALMSNKDKNLSEGTKLSWNPESGKYSTIDKVKSGYYLIVDSAAGTGDAISDYIVQIVDNTDIKAKTSAPEVDKTVYDDEDDTATGGDGFAESATDGFYETADHEINESFEFKLKATIPADADLAAYESYKVVFKDTMSKGVKYEGDEKLSVTVKINKNDDESIVEKEEKLIKDENEYTVVSSGDPGQEDGTKLTVTIEDLFKLTSGNIGEAIKAAFGKAVIEIEVTYSAHLTEDAVVAKAKDKGPANTNKVILEYSNKPYTEGDGDSMGKTPEDTVYVFTYELPNKKTDKDDNPLTGAEFRLYKSEDGKDEMDEIKLKQNPDDKSYSPIEDQKSGEGVVMKPSEEEGTKGEFKLKGLDAGTYWLEETKAPTGYNKLEKRLKIVVKVTEHKETDGTGINAETNYSIEIGEGEEAELIIDSEKSNGVNKIKNFKGTTLPETGGMGTTIFYVVGSVLVLAAAVLLVTKRRMNAE